MSFLRALTGAGARRRSLEWPFPGVPLGSGAGWSPWQAQWNGRPVERVGGDFVGLVAGGLMADSAVFAVEHIRVSVFSQARFLWQRLNNGRPGDFFPTQDLSILERPWPGGTTGDLLSRMLLHADFAGNSYTIRPEPDELAMLRPDWVDIVLEPRLLSRPEDDDQAVAGWRKLGYLYWHEGARSGRPLVLALDEVCHFAPSPDPSATYRGMAWLTPVIREIEADRAMTAHKGAFIENAATPLMAVSFPREIDVDDFHEIVDEMERVNAGPRNAGKTMYLAGGADPTVIGASLQQMDFKSVQGAGETRIAAAGGVGAVLAKLSEGLQGSSLNAGNFAAARRLFADTTAQNLWGNVATSLEVLVPRPTNRDGSVDELARLWHDTRDVPFMRDDATDAAAIAESRARTLKAYLDAGFTPDSAKRALTAGDEALLQHSGLFSVQLQPPGAPTTPTGGQPA